MDDHRFQEKNPQNASTNYLFRVRVVFVSLHTVIYSSVSTLAHVKIFNSKISTKRKSASLPCDYFTINREVIIK